MIALYSEEGTMDYTDYPGLLLVMCMAGILFTKVLA